MSYNLSRILNNLQETIIVNGSGTGGDGVKHISSDTFETTIDSNLVTKNILCNNIKNRLGTTNINLTDDMDISINCTKLLLNGEQITSGIPTVLTHNVSLGEFDVTDIGFQSLRGISNTQAFESPIIYDTQARVVNISSESGVSTTFDGSIISTKSTFTNPQEVITKSYVDNAINSQGLVPYDPTPAVSLDSVRYITSTELLTNINSSVSIDDGIGYSPFSSSAPSVSSTVPNWWTLGFKFTLTQQVTINRIGIPSIHWIVPNTRDYKIYVDGNTSPIHTFNLAQQTIYNDFYVQDVNITLNAGSYRIGIDSKTNDRYNSNAPMIFDSRITSVMSVIATQPNTYPNLNEQSNVASTGGFWIADSVISSLNVKSIVCPEIKTLSSEIGVKNNINLNNNNITNVGLINGSKVPKGGIFSQTSTFYHGGGVIPETNLIGASGLGTGTIYGSLSIPSNGFSAGDTFLIKIGGRVTCQINDVFTFRLRLNFDSSGNNTTTSSPILSVFTVTSDSALSNSPWTVEAICTLSNVGSVYTMFTDSHFTYFNSSGLLKGVGSNTSTVINTTIQNQFGFTYETNRNMTMIVTNTIINKLY